MQECVFSTFHEGRRLQHGEQGALEDHADGPQHKHSPHQGPDTEERQKNTVTIERKLGEGEFTLLCFLLLHDGACARLYTTFVCTCV